jgi:hypothetical protein
MRKPALTLSRSESRFRSFIISLHYRPTRIRTPATNASTAVTTGGSPTGRTAPVPTKTREIPSRSVLMLWVIRTVIPASYSDGVARLLRSQQQLTLVPSIPDGHRQTASISLRYACRSRWFEITPLHVLSCVDRTGGHVYDLDRDDVLASFGYWRLRFQLAAKVAELPV